MKTRYFDFIVQFDVYLTIVGHRFTAHWLSLSNGKEGGAVGRGGRGAVRRPLDGWYTRPAMADRVSGRPPFDMSCPASLCCVESRHPMKS